MGNTRTLIAWLVVLGLQLTPHVTYAEDGGPGREVRAIRHDLPIILSATATPTESLTIDTVVVDGNDAIAQWHVGERMHLAILRRRYNRWWLDTDISPYHRFTRGLLLTRQLPAKLVDAAVANMPLIANDSSLTYLLGDGPHFPDVLHLTAGASQSPYDKNYRLTITFAKSDASSDADLGYFASRAPTEGESWATRCGNGYFFFSGTLESGRAVHVDPGTKIDVWFPFALDPKSTYSLTIAHVDPIIGPLSGSLSSNTVHFELPAFAIEPGAELMGEIDGDPYQC